MRNKKVFTKERDVADVFDLSKILTCYFQVYPYSNSPIAAPPPRLCITAVTLSLKLGHSLPSLSPHLQLHLNPLLQPT